MHWCQSPFASGSLRGWRLSLRSSTGEPKPTTRWSTTRVRRRRSLHWGVFRAIVVLRGAAELGGAASRPRGLALWARLGAPWRLLLRSSVYVILPPAELGVRLAGCGAVSLGRSMGLRPNPTAGSGNGDVSDGPVSMRDASVHGPGLRTGAHQRDDHHFGPMIRRFKEIPAAPFVEPGLEQDRGACTSVIAVAGTFIERCWCDRLRHSETLLTRRSRNQRGGSCAHPERSDIRRY